MDEIYNYLSKYTTFIEDELYFYAIIYLLPSSYIYQLILNLNENEHYLIEGDLETGVAQQGSINIKNYCINITDANGNDHVLIALPQPFDI